MTHAKALKWAGKIFQGDILLAKLRTLVTRRHLSLVSLLPNIDDCPEPLVSDKLYSVCLCSSLEVVSAARVVAYEGWVPLGRVNTRVARSRKTGEWVQTISLQVRVPQRRLQGSTNTALSFSLSE